MLRTITLSLSLLMLSIGASLAQETAKTPYRPEPSEVYLTTCVTQVGMEKFVQKEFGAIRMSGTLVGTETAANATPDRSCRRMLVRVFVGETTSKMLPRNGLGVFLIRKIRVIAVSKGLLGNWTTLAQPMELYGADLEPALII